MLLNNFIGTMLNGASIKDASGNIGTMNFNSYTSMASVEPTLYKETSTNASYAGRVYPFQRGLAFGTGTTPATINDYKIENFITTGLSYSSNTQTINNSIVAYVQNVQNTTTEPITITEVGVFCDHWNSYPASLLITRTVLDTPVVLQPNDVKTFTVTIDYNKFIDNTAVSS